MVFYSLKLFFSTIRFYSSFLSHIIIVSTTLLQKQKSSIYRLFLILQLKDAKFGLSVHAHNYILLLNIGLFLLSSKRPSRNFRLFLIIRLLLTTNLRGRCTIEGITRCTCPIKLCFGKSMP
ncbi:MAG: putative membrane protein [Bacillariaceae sp.]|jgi:uncharacterized membrane protein